MTEQKRPANHTQAKGKTTNEKSGGKTAARAGAGTKRAIERKKAPAKARAPKPQPATEIRQPDGGDPAGIPQPAEAAQFRPAKRGIACLKEGARNIVEKDAKHLLKGLKEKARQGSANDVKLLLDLARLNEEKPAAKPDEESCMAMLQDLASQQEYQEQADAGDQTGDSQPGFLQTAGDAAESPLKP